jgi:hypothetical protein
MCPSLHPRAGRFQARAYGTAMRRTPALQTGTLVHRSKGAPAIRPGVSQARGVRELKERGFEAFLDRTDIAPGEPWKERLAALIAAVDTIIYVGCYRPPAGSYRSSSR